MTPLLPKRYNQIKRSEPTANGYNNVIMVTQGVHYAVALWTPSWRSVRECHVFTCNISFQPRFFIAVKSIFSEGISRRMNLIHTIRRDASCSSCINKWNQMLPLRDSRLCRFQMAKSAILEPAPIYISIRSAPAKPWLPVVIKNNSIRQSVRSQTIETI